MLQICSSVLLLTMDEKLILYLKEVARMMKVSLQVESDWNKAYRVNAERIITDSSYLEYINRAYYELTVLALRASEKLTGLKSGVSHFIFDRYDMRELELAMMREDRVFVHCSSEDITDIMQHSDVTSYIQGEYRFNFDRNNFVYKGKRLYLTESQQAYLAEWLINGHKDNSKRMTLCNLRKKFGKDFLSDINRFGQWEGGKDECTGDVS